MKKLTLVIALALANVWAFSQTKTKNSDTAKNAPVTTTTAFRVNYDYVFKRNTDGSYSPLHPVQINGEMMGSGASFPVGTPFGGVDVGAYAGHDLLIDTVRGVVIIRKFLNR